MPDSLGRPIPERVLRRVWSRIRRGHPTECWLSTWSVGSHGYPQIGWHVKGLGRSTMTLVHRAVWTGLHGQIPAGMTVDHAERNPRCPQACCNPSHLRLLTNVDNARDNRQAQRGPGLRSYKEVA